jgi:hypothetical protein
VGPGPYAGLLEKIALVGVDPEERGAAEGAVTGVNPVEPLCFALQVDHFAARIAPGRPASPRAFAKEYERLLDSYGVESAVVIGHSLGTGYASYLSRFAPRRVAAIALIDPICCMLHHARTTRAFVYQPVGPSVKVACEEYYVRRELFTANVIARHFRWHEATLWPSECTPQTPHLIVLSEEDQIVPVQALRSCATELRYSTFAEVVGLDEKICNPIDAMQWLKVQRAFAMVTDYEQRLKKMGKAARFDWVVRLRTDLVFFGPLPSLGQLSTQNVHVPVGVVSRRTLLNDHIALVPRTLAHGYFDTVDELKCNRTAMLEERALHGSDSSELGQDADAVLRRLPPCASNVARQPAHPASNGTGCTQIHDRIVQDQSGARLLASRLKYAFGIDVIKHNIGYTLLRSTTGADCSRLKNSPITEASWWAACLNLSRFGIPVFCLEAPNTSAVASATRLIGRPYDAYCVGTCHTWSPRCEQLPVRPSPLSWPLSPHHFSTKNSVNLSATSRWVPYMPHKPPAWPAMAFTPSVDWSSRVDSVDVVDDVQHHSGLV